MQKKRRKINGDKPSKSNDDYDGDVFLYHGNITPDGHHQISEIFEKKGVKKQRACIVLITYGGDPGATYRIARAINHHYKQVEILIPDICKSAGTLLCIGAHKLIIGDRGELGPLDVQISKPDELFESVSGLGIIQALSTLRVEMLRAFEAYLFEIRGGSGLRTKMAADIAAGLAQGLLSPIVEKLDPATLGEHLRAMRVGHEYGERLAQMTDSLKPEALETLVTGFPSHAFVIDRKEATTFFNTVEAPDKTTNNLYLWARDHVKKQPYPASPLVQDYFQQPETEEQNDEIQNTHTDETSDSHGSTANGEAERESRGNESDGVPSTG